MKFMLLLFNDEAGFATMSEAERGAAFGAYMAFNGALQEAGAFVSGDPLLPSATAVQVRAPGGVRQTEHGAYGANALQLGGTYVIDVADSEAAIGWAVRCPAAAHGVVEVRPLMPLG
ncbi:MAG: YciI family protein [Sphingopyxis sp.]|nr:YciI family protein [Sphingopyxis sp.]